MAERERQDIKGLAPTFNLIGGEWVEAGGHELFDDVNPSDVRDVVGRFPRSREDDVLAAVAAATAAYPAWRAVPPPRRGLLLLSCAAVLRERKEALASLMSREMGKPLVEARGDVQEAIDCAEFYAGEGRRLLGDTTPCELPDKMALSIRRPIGVCGLITPWNFPVAIPAWKVFPALICGNTVVFKPAGDAPACGSAFVKALQDAGIPAGVINLVQGRGSEVGTALVSHPDVPVISFTGSSVTGRMIAERCGRDLKRVSLELGGKNAQIVMDDADLDLALEGALWGAFGTAGQRCTATSRILLHAKIKKAFMRRFLEKVRGLKVGDPRDTGNDVGPLVNGAQLESVASYVKVGKDDGARLVCGGNRLGGELQRGFFFAPTVFDRVHPSMRIAQEEIFGPVASVIEVRSFEHAVEVLNDTPYGLSSSIYTRDVNLACRAIRDLEAGITYVNGPTIGAEVHLPFGGVKNTGNGHREAGSQVLDTYSEWKAVYLDYSGRLQKAQIDA